MTPRQFLALVVRLFAVWLATQAPSGVWAAYQRYLALGGPTAGWVAGGIVLLLLLLGTWLAWTFPATIARVVLGPGEETPAATAPPTAWLEVGYSVVGVFVLTQALPSVVHYAWVLAFPPELSDGYPRVHWLCIHLLELVIGLWLALGPASVRRTIEKVKYAGSKAAP